MTRTKDTCSYCGKEIGDNEVLFQNELGTSICAECVENAYNALMETKAQTSEPSKTYNPSMMTPTQIYDFLNQYVIGQDNAKRILSVAVYNHMKLLEHYDNIEEGDVEVEKSNIILVGPSGKQG